MKPRDNILQKIRHLMKHKVENILLLKNQGTDCWCRIKAVNRMVPIHVAVKHQEAINALSVAISGYIRSTLTESVAIHR